MTDTQQTMAKRLEAADVRHVFVEFADVNGMSRSKQLTTERFLDVWEDGIPVNMLLLVQTTRNEVPSNSKFGEAIGYGDGILRPDPSTLRTLPWRDDAARVLCDVEYEGQRVAAAPRSALRNVLDSADVGIEFGVGSELEFYLLEESDEGYAPATDHKHEWVSEVTERVAPFYDRLSKWAPAYGIPIHSLEHEHGPGQLEVLFDHSDALTQADRTFDFVRLVKRTATLTDTVGTFMPKPFGDESGSGYHLHVSAQRDGENAFDDGADTLSEVGRQFVGGLVEHADALTAFGIPTLNGYKRLDPEGFAPYAATWGYDDRRTAFRVPSGYTRVENRIGAADANPYLFIAATLAAGLDGIERGLDAGRSGAETVDGDARTLPQTPMQAFEALENDDALIGRLGSDAVEAYLCTRRRDLAAFDACVTDWERERYVDMR
ncbi:glutamine synthetase [Halarchaeum solikamskense]|uniref:glutamine synthetase family protein n=1 Tax=Halarchaeum nitratireducens TaxID=489913 RepID=UPI001B3AA6B5|nr:glutamine synthetase family protein [Halarchaeum solikamskense]MBP2252400.1 glutamine synthetase [Halarchaeum solikamskense]